jgi:hypothetical protein
MLGASVEDDSASFDADHSQRVQRSANDVAPA